MKKNLIVMLIIFLVLSLVQVTVATSNDGTLIQNTVDQFLEARWKLLQGIDSSLEQHYDLTVQGALSEIARDKSIVQKYFVDIYNEYGIIVHDVRTYTKFNEMNIKGNSARVNVTVEAEVDAQIGDEKYTSYYAGIEHDFILIKKQGNWLISKHRSLDMYTQAENEKELFGVNEANDEEITERDIVKETTISDLSSGDVGIMWYLYYQRSGAVTYASNHWKSATDMSHRNPNYKYYSGNNCANFVSQCFLEGGNAIMHTSGTWVWWYDNKGTPNPSDDTHSNSWSLAADQAYHLVRITDVSKHRGQYVSNASDLIIGDSIYYDWTNNGVINHTVIVVAVRNGVPFVAGAYFDAAEPLG